MSKVQPIHWTAAEQLAGRRLDRRRAYARDGRKVLELCRYTTNCSGCTELEDGQNVNGYPRDAKHGCLIGAGCGECGYTGKRREALWVPLAGQP